MKPVDLLNIIVEAGNTAVFTVGAAGKFLEYQWQMDGLTHSDSVKYSGANGTTLTVNNVVASDEGNYHVTISNDAGSVDSAVAVLTISE